MCLFVNTDTVTQYLFWHTIKSRVRPFCQNGYCHAIPILTALHVRAPTKQSASWHIQRKELRTLRADPYTQDAPTSKKNIHCSFIVTSFRARVKPRLFSFLAVLDHSEQAGELIMNCCNVFIKLLNFFGGNVTASPCNEWDLRSIDTHFY